MKLHQLTASLIAGIIAGYASAQEPTYTEETTPLNITTPGLTEEEYVNRTTDASMGTSIVIRKASYSGKNINITNNANSASGISLEGGPYPSFSTFNLTAEKGTWSTVTMNGDNATGLTFGYYARPIYVTNTEIYNKGNGGRGIYNDVVLFKSDALQLDNVNIHLSTTTADGNTGVGIYGSATNKGKGQVTITSDNSGTGVAISGGSAGSIVDLYNTTINVARTTTDQGILRSYGTTTISLTNSNISSSAGNTLISGLGKVNLNNVKLGNAKNQKIYAFGAASTGDPLNINFSNGTKFDGYADIDSEPFGDGDKPDYSNSRVYISLTISSNSSWNVTQNSVMGPRHPAVFNVNGGSVIVDGTSRISFEELSSGTFTNITAATIALDAGAILMLGADAEAIQALIDGGNGKYNVTLFLTDNTFSNEGVIMVTSDNHILEYTTNNLGTYTLLNVLPASIPEPTTATLGLAAIGLFALRRRTPVRI